MMQYRSWRLLAGCVAVYILYLSCGGDVLAQETVSAPFIQADQDGEAKINQLIVQYRQDVQVYRQRERDFQRSVQEYQQLQTFTAESFAVQSTKSAMEARNQVLATYLSLLQETIQLRVGIPEDVRASLLKDLRDLSKQLQSHTEQLGHVGDRAALRDAVSAFTPIAAELQYKAQVARQVLRLAKLQVAYTEVSNAVVLVTSQIDTTQGENTRTIAAIAELQKSASQNLTTLFTLASELTVFKDDAIISPAAVYVSLSQIVQYIDQIVASQQQL